VEARNTAQVKPAALLVSARRDQRFDGTPVYDEIDIGITEKRRIRVFGLFSGAVGWEARIMGRMSKLFPLRFLRHWR
jgi:hypothetical protein